MVQDEGKRVGDELRDDVELAGGDAAEGAMKRTGEDRIFTVPNLLSFIRLLLIPVFFYLYVFEDRILAGMVVFAVAACTDWIDGTVARATNSVTKLGRVLDPLVDRLLLIFGVIAVFCTGRIPLWIMILLFARDIILGILTLYIKNRYGNDLVVSYVGKFATAFMMFAFCMLMINWPIVPGLGLFEISWLPGWGAGRFSLGIFFAYVGVVLQWITAGIYLYRGIRYGTTARDHGLSASASASEASAATAAIAEFASSTGLVESGGEGDDKSGSDGEGVDGDGGDAGGSSEAAR